MKTKMLYAALIVYGFLMFTFWEYKDLWLIVHNEGTQVWQGYLKDAGPFVLVSVWAVSVIPILMWGIYNLYIVKKELVLKVENLEDLVSKQDNKIQELKFKLFQLKHPSDV